MEHKEDPDRPYWCVCGLAGLYETPGEWVCHRSVKPSQRGSGPTPYGIVYGH